MKLRPIVSRSDKCEKEVKMLQIARLEPVRQSLTGPWRIGGLQKEVRRTGYHRFLFCGIGVGKYATVVHGLRADFQERQKLFAMWNIPAQQWKDILYGLGPAVLVTRWSP